MNCTRWREQLIAEQTGLLSSQEQQPLHAHLNSCADCMATSAELAHTFALLDQQEQPSAQLQEQFAQRLASTTSMLLASPARSFSLVAWFQKLWPSRPISAFSYSLTLLCLGVFCGQLLPLGATTNADGQMALPGSSAQGSTLICPVQYSPFNHWSADLTVKA